MDRYCEFCVNLRSVIYCKADAAYLCLSCDTKVHSANPLSNRHYRTLICDTCRRRPTYVQCYDHQKFMCRGCDLSQHDASCQHRKRVINSYMGCPTAGDLGVLWGFDWNPFVDGSIVLNPKFGSMPSASTHTSAVSFESIVQMKEIYGGMQAFSILQQLVDLLKVQTSEVDHISYVIRCQERKVENDVDQFSQQIVGGHSSNPHDLSLDPCPSIFDHLESETNETGHQGDSFWQCKSPIPSSQLWSHNMQDLGVCEESSCLEDLNMPDIDLTFRNFEEVFRIEQEPTKVDHVKAEISPKKACYTSQIMSFSHSRLAAESSGTICIHSGISPSCGLIEHNEPLKWMDSKQGQYGYRKARSDTRKRTKSQNWKFESHESVARSC